MSSESKTSIYDIAKELGISVSTVSRALKNHKAISRNTIKKVKETAERLNYTPNTFAVNLKNGKTTTIGIVVPEISRRFFSYAIDGIEQEAYKAGYKNICEIGKERIRRAGKKIKEEGGLMAQNLDTGFRVLKLDSSNMNDVYYTPEEFDINSLFSENVKTDRS